MGQSKLQAGSFENRVFKLIPLKILWTGGAPAIVLNPENEAIALTDNAAGDVTLTFTNASLIPLTVVGHMLEVADANTLSLDCNLDGAPTTTVLKIVINSGADGATETDPVALHLLVGKYEAATV